MSDRVLFEATTSARLSGHWWFGEQLTARPARPCVYKTRGPSCHSGRGAVVVVRSACLAREGRHHSQQQIQVSPGSCELPSTQATSCSPSGLPLSRSPSLANHSLSPQPCSIQSTPFQQSQSSSRSPVARHISSQCLLPQNPVSCPPYLLPYPPSKPLLPSPVHPKFSLLLSLFFILVLLLSLNWSWSISHTSKYFHFTRPFKPVIIQIPVSLKIAPKFLLLLYPSPPDLLTLSNLAYTWSSCAVSWLSEFFILSITVLLYFS